MTLYISWFLFGGLLSRFCYLTTKLKKKKRENWGYFYAMNLLLLFYTFLRMSKAITVGPTTTHG